MKLFRFEHEAELLEVGLGPAGAPGSSSTNGRLLNSILRRAAVVSNVGDGLARDVARLYLAALRETRAAILRSEAGGYGAGTFAQELRAERVRAMLAELEPVVERLGAGVRAEFRSTLEALYRAEHETGLALVRGALPESIAGRITLYRPPLGALEVGNVEVMGQSLDRWGRRASAWLLDDLAREINLGNLQGDDMRQLTRRAGRVFDVSARAARDTARTAVQTVSNEANARLFQANRGLIRGVEHQSVFDKRTCPVCAGLDGKTYSFEGSPSYESRPRLPVHMNCRCVYVPVTVSWRELGIPIDEVPRGDRASMDGQVAGSTDFPSWLRSQPASVADEILGRGRAELWRSGQYELSDFIRDRTYRPVPLRELRARLERATG